MKIPADDNQAGVSIEPRERGLDESIRVAVALSGYGFTGRSSTVWIGERTLARFLEDLGQTERARRGTARLQAMSLPDDFELSVEIVDRAGHTRVGVKVSRLVYGSGGSAQPTVALSFGFDPSRLPMLLREFQALAEYGGSGPHTAVETDGKDTYGSSP